MGHLTKPERSASPQGVPHAAGAYRDETKPHTPAYSAEPIANTALDSDFARKLRQLSLAEISAFLKRTRRQSLTAAGAVFGLIALFVLVERTAAWYRDVRERRHELAVNTVTPERLIARCGAAEQDVSKAVYPILLRTMNYPARGNRTLALAFSRTAEEKSDWVFLSMKDENGSSYDTPDAKIAALPCLDSTK